MSDKTTLTEPYGTIQLAPEVPSIVLTWTGFANSEQLRNLMDETLRQYIGETKRHKGPVGWIADLQGLGAVKQVDQEWLLTHWNPRAYVAGVRYIAFVEAESVFGKISGKQYVTNVAQSEEFTFHIRYVPTLAAAKAWLAEVLPITPTV
ncbi:hypothetical protein [Hymenobacter glacialis]|uniref:STAS/SEC14 domain-containing protein n=1 Tax=Hymenobacter glacialis TaxID=1908236 RepID=A0A1G1T413_9BACT|nr:hypothetical protein [Hymenobacter glacialis]OGX85596.1 hypothetical protein BEN48_01820 [Hymenobacter glacialis]